MIETAGKNFKNAFDPIVDEVLGESALNKKSLPDGVHPTEKASYDFGAKIGQIHNGHVCKKSVFITGDSSLCFVYQDESGQLFEDKSGTSFFSRLP